MTTLLTLLAFLASEQSGTEVERILAGLGDNSSCLLPAAKVEGEFGPILKEFGLDKNGPQGRDFSIKMAWMSDRKRAFYCGANHGSPHRMNDAWEYDLPSNTWSLLYDPDYNDAGDRMNRLAQAGVTLKDGVLVTARGGPVHVAHTWWGLTYDPELQAALWMCVWPGYGMKEKLEHVQSDASQLYKGPPLWAFFPAEKKWQPILSQPPFLQRVGLAGTLQYIPDLRGSLWYHRDNGTWLFDSNAGEWKDLKPTVQKGSQPLMIENVMCYDSKNKVLVAHREDKDGFKKTYHYDVAANAWTRTVESADGPAGHDASTQFYHDSVGEVCLLFENGSKKLWAYSVTGKKWTQLAPQGAPPPDWKRLIGYFDPARNVYVVLSQRNVWVYRYRRAAR